MPSGTAEHDPSPDAKDVPETTAAQTGRLQTRAVLRVILIILAVAAVLWILYLLEGVILLVVRKQANKEVPLPLGPYLAGAGLVCLALGPARVPSLFPFAFPFGGP